MLFCGPTQLAAVGLAFFATKGLLMLLMLLLASTQTEAVPASKKNKIAAHHQTIENSSQLCKHFSDTVNSERMKHRAFIRTNSNLNESSNVKNFHERQVRSIDNAVKKDIASFVRYENATIRNVPLGNSFRDTALSNEESKSIENISQATLASSDIKPSVQKDSSDKVYLHVNGETVWKILLPISTSSSLERSRLDKCFFRATSFFSFFISTEECMKSFWLKFCDFYRHQGFSKFFK